MRNMLVNSAACARCHFCSLNGVAAAMVDGIRGLAAKRHIPEGVVVMSVCPTAITELSDLLRLQA